MFIEKVEFYLRSHRLHDLDQKYSSPESEMDTNELRIPNSWSEIQKYYFKHTSLK